MNYLYFIHINVIFDFYHEIGFVAQIANTMILLYLFLLKF